MTVVIIQTDSSRRACLAAMVRKGPVMGTVVYLISILPLCSLKEQPLIIRDATYLKRSMALLKY